METINDIRREEGNPRGPGPMSEKPRSIFSFFREHAAARLVAILLIALGALLTLAGAVLFIGSLMMVGLAIVIVSFFGYLWSRPDQNIL